MATELLSGGMIFPPLAQFIDQRSFNVLHDVPPPSEADGLTQFIPPGHTEESLFNRPFHIYHDDFLDVIGPNPTLTLLNHTQSDPIFHEAPIWNPATDEMFFAQNAGSPAAGTGLAKSAIIQNHSRHYQPKECERSGKGGGCELGCGWGTIYKDKLLFIGQGQGESIAPAIYLMDPVPPYDTKVLLDNFFGRQFNSLNDVAINPRNGDIYFTDPSYGHAQSFRRPPGLPRQAWRFNEASGAVTVAADGFNMPNGITFSPSGAHAYITDSGMALGYRFDVDPASGTLSNRQTFAFASPGIPDGVHVNTRGNVYVGCGDGVHVYNPSGTLIGKIYVGPKGAANFQFAGRGRMVILAETELYFATLQAEEALPGRKSFSTTTMAGLKRAAPGTDDAEFPPEADADAQQRPHPSKRRRRESSSPLPCQPPPSSPTDCRNKPDHERPDANRGRDLLSPLSDELLVRILSFLSPAHLLAVAPVSRRFYRLAADSQLWKALYYARFRQHHHQQQQRREGKGC
ncbi:hypothetical protein VTK26DRAFT_8841 [Humicola hyalothermophila]